MAISVAKWRWKEYAVRIVFREVSIAPDVRGVYAEDAWWGCVQTRGCSNFRHNQFHCVASLEHVSRPEGQDLRWSEGAVGKADRCQDCIGLAIEG